VNLEAMASGLAMVCADAPNTRALLQPGLSARLCAAADPAAYAQAIQALIDDPVERSRLQRGALAQSIAYRWPEILQAVVEVYREASAAGAVGPPPPPRRPALQTRAR
jgi:glycosyltransferase involved in cell wall biosynthesis